MNVGRVAFQTTAQNVLLTEGFSSRCLMPEST